MAHNLETELAPETRLSQSVDPLTAIGDSLLVVWAQNGEQLAYVELCRRHRERVFRTALKITRNTDDAEDVLQDSWMKAFAHLGSFDGRSAFSTWVTRIAINSALTILRKRRTRREFPLDDLVDCDNCRATEMSVRSRNPEERCLETEGLRLVRQAIKRLPPKLRTAIESRQSQDGSLTEVAMSAGVSLTAMRSRLTRARLRLREPLSRALKVKSASDASRQRNEEDSTGGRKSRPQNLSKEIAIERNQLSTNKRSIPLKEARVSNKRNEDGHFVIEEDSRGNCSVMQEV